MFFFLQCLLTELPLTQNATSTASAPLTEAIHSDPLGTMAIMQGPAVHALDNTWGIPFHRAGNETK